MAYQSLYRRYRSQKFSELRGQAHVTTALRTAVAEGRTGHAYLFSGPRGTGKTSTARILAKALNCENEVDGEPCNECESCIAIGSNKQTFDLFELDAASHNKVDDIRDLISRVNLGSPGRTKVYILDEVHMLSSGAENALLKTLEEPPEHVVFVLATTEPHKVVPTIRSRTQHFAFHLLPADELEAHVRFIIEDAGLDVDDAGIQYVLAQGGGSARDTLSALDLVAAAGGAPAGSDVGVTVARAIGTAGAEAAIAAVQEGLSAGHEPRVIGENTVDVLRSAFLASMGAPLDHLADQSQATSKELASELGPATLTRSLEAIGQALVEMRQAPDPRVPLEVCLLKLCRPAGSVAAAAPQPDASASSSSKAAAPVAADPQLGGRIEALEQQLAALQQQIEELVANGSTVGPDGDAAPSGPAAAARSRLGNVAAKAPPSPRTKRRGDKQSNGVAKERAGSAPQAPPSEAANEDPPKEQTSKEQTSKEQTSKKEPPKEAARKEDAAREAAQEEPTTRPNLTAALTLASVTDAFADQLDGVRQKVRVRFKGGRVLRVEGTTVTFGVPTPIHRDRCSEVKDEIERAFSDFFGQTVSLDVVVDGDAPAPNMDVAKIESKPVSEITADEDVGPVEELEDATDQSASGLDRLTKAFPGSTIVEPEPEKEQS